jgi:two-component system, OmpR family, osmolarity sensor histidine kinase EnvZ
MTLLPRTLFWRAFVVQMVFMLLILTLLLVFVTRDQARISAANLAAVWAPALQEVLEHPAPSAAPQDVRVVREVTVVQQAPPGNAYRPIASPRFDALVEALLAERIPVQSIAVSGVTENTVVWFELAAGGAPKWLGVVSNLEGEDFSRRLWWLTLAGVAISAGLAAVTSRMVARPAQQLALAAQAYAQGRPLPPLPRGAPAEIDALARTVIDTFAQRQALDAQRSLMLAGLSHDVRSPLARIQLAADMLPAGDEEAEGLRQLIQRNVEVLDRLVASFADYVRTNDGALDTPTDVARVAADALAAHGLPASALTVEGAVSVPSHGDLLRRALDNLLDNAHRYGQAPITVRVTARERGVRVEVRNAGQPVNAAEVPRLMQPFERGELHRGTPGSGLGLAIVRAIALRHGGGFRLEPLPASHGTAGTVAVLDIGGRS